MRHHLLAAALLLLAVAACQERGRGTSGPYIGGGAGANVSRDR